MSMFPRLLGACLALGQLAILGLGAWVGSAIGGWQGRTAGSRALGEVGVSVVLMVWVGGCNEWAQPGDWVHSETQGCWQHDVGWLPGHAALMGVVGALMGVALAAWEGWQKGDCGEHRDATERRGAVGSGEVQRGAMVADVDELEIGACINPLQCTPARGGELPSRELLLRWCKLPGDT